MKKIDFKVTFLSDIVLNKSSNTEGNVETLDFITGASFLGMVAKNYDKFENFDDAQKALNTKGNKPYNGKMAIIKVE